MNRKKSLYDVEVDSMKILERHLRQKADYYTIEFHKIATVGKNPISAIKSWGAKEALEEVADDLRSVIQERDCEALNDPHAQKIIKQLLCDIAIDDYLKGK